ncbi:MAG: signal peptidase I [Acidilobaceae archaeon]|nr:signal peptidase I [Acidilobaceae archaeon]MCX8165969.1 signal peptidase I [Acidilobaceae archaeon]MDW7974612.1 signal peptidase I [Sulfolobales archaeon]
MKHSISKLLEDRQSLAALALLIALYLIFRAAGGGMAAVSGGSMEPSLHSGDLVFIIKSNDVRKGDIIVFRSGGGYVIHRVIDVYSLDGMKCYVTQGDNNPFPDPGSQRCAVPGRTVYGVPDDLVVGVVIEFLGFPVKIPYVGSLALLLRG